MQHGTWPWRGSHDRLSIFMKYAPLSTPSIGRCYLPEEYSAMDAAAGGGAVSEAALRLLQPPRYSEGQSMWADPAAEEVLRLRDDERSRQKRSHAHATARL